MVLLLNWSNCRILHKNEILTTSEKNNIPEVVVSLGWHILFVPYLVIALQLFKMNSMNSPIG